MSPNYHRDSKPRLAASPTPDGLWVMLCERRSRIRYGVTKGSVMRRRLRAAVRLLRREVPGALAAREPVRLLKMRSGGRELERTGSSFSLIQVRYTGVGRRGLTIAFG